MRAYICSEIMGMADKISGEDSGRQAWWQRYGITGMDTAVQIILDGNRRDVVQQRWQNGLEERQWTGKISTGND